MEPIRATTQRLIKTLSAQRHQDKENILAAGLRSILTKEERKHIKYYSFKDTQVILNLDSSVWIYLLNLKKKQLLNNLNQNLTPKEAVNEIILRLDAGSSYIK